MEKGQYPSTLLQGCAPYKFLDKNRLLCQGNTAKALQTLQMIPKAKGSVGSAGYCLITEMKLDKAKEKDRTLYNDILVSL